MEVIDLSDDDNDIIVEEVPRKPKQKRPFRCINSDCRTEQDLIPAEDFVRRYYGVLSYPKKKRVCQKCYLGAVEQQESLIDVIKSKHLLLAEKLPLPKTSVNLTDSDSDPSDNENVKNNSDVEIECDKDKTLEETISAIISEFGLNTQVLEGAEHIGKRLEELHEGFEKLEREEYSIIEKELNNIRSDFYDAFTTDILWQPALDIGPSSTVVHQPDGTSEVIAEDSVHYPTEALPPVGPLDRYELKPNELCFSMKYSLYARWVAAQVVEVDKRDVKSTLYKIRYNRTTKGGGLMRSLPGRQLAYPEQCATRIPVGTRIIAKYRDDDPKNQTISGSYYVGIIAEIPTAANKYRYLVFFDDGYAQYVVHKDIRVVVEASSCPWDDVSSDSREFIKEYLQMYPERPMVRLQKDNFVKTEWNGRWWRAQVLQVDGSLVRMFFPVEERTEWIYRGSTRLSPLFNKKMNKAQAEQLKTARRRTAAVLPGRAVVEYNTHGQGQDMDSAPKGERRAVARKSTMTRASTPPREVQVRMEQESKGYANNHMLQEKIMKYRAHTCCARCLGKTGDRMLMDKNVSPLLFPLLQGWNRIVAKHRTKWSLINGVFYIAPCGLRLRNIDEVFQYIVDTDSRLEIDCFSFEKGIHVTIEWEPFKKIYFTEDMSKGEENVKISCVNSLDEDPPFPLTYCNVRLPTENVPLNLDQDFLVCCDCTDNCQDVTKCTCRQLTIQGTRALSHSEIPNAGYQHRRLYEQVRTGIYECNSRCKCAANRCSNRVVQFPLRLKLQLFKTARRGWGVRTLCDIPTGGFICVYVGKILIDNVANEEGKQIIGGDDYYAELDYIEVLESLKEGFEEEAVSPEEEKLTSRQKSYVPSESSESDDFVSENEPDNAEVDEDFNGPRSRKAKSQGTREKSARIQERAKARKSGKKGSADNSSSKGGKKTKSASSSADDEEDEEEGQKRQKQAFLPSQLLGSLLPPKEVKSIREYYGKDESVYIMDAKHTGNIGRYFNHSCQPNVFVQNVFVDTHDLRFPWISFFALHNISAGTELTWDYNYEVDSVPGKVKYCYCCAKNCRGRLL